MAEAVTRPGRPVRFAVPTPFRECPDCGKHLLLRRLPPDRDSRCPRCSAVLQRNRRDPIRAPLALAMAGLALYAVTVALPFLQLDLYGRMRLAFIGSSAEALLENGFWPLTLLVGTTLVLMPLLKLGLLLLVLAGVRSADPPRWLAAAFRHYNLISQWAMLEVFLFGALVSYTRLRDLAQVRFEMAAYTLPALALLLVAIDAALDTEAIWEALARRGATPARVPPADRSPADHAPPAAPAAQALPPPVRRIGCHGCHMLCDAVPGQHCPRCGAVLHRRKPDSVARTWALIAAAAVLYVPANYFPVMNIVTLGRGGPHTILGGAKEFIDSGFWPLALIIFLASVAVPMLKLVSLILMLLGIHRRSTRRLHDRTRLYRLVEAIGRWSMIDVFVVSVLVSLVRFGTLANITSDVGAVCFAGVVVLTMFAAESFDPRLMWDAAEQRR